MPIERLSTALTLSSAPLDWAITQNNLGRALEALGESEAGTGLLHQAMAAYKAALEERCRDLAPSSWATTNSNLGNALVAIAERENSNAMLEERRPIAPRLRHGRRRARHSTPPRPTSTSPIRLGPCGTGRATGKRFHAVEAALGLIKEIGVQAHIPAAELARDSILAAMGRREPSAIAA